jgi:hypothetical protein
VFSSVEKPKSAKKGGKTAHTPLKSKKLSLFLEELIGLKSEISDDRSQVKTFLNRTKYPDMCDLMLRTVLDLPTFSSKASMLSVLSLLDSYSGVFGIQLGDTLNRLLAVREVMSKPVLGLDKEDKSKSELLAQETSMLLTLAQLVGKVSLTSAETSQKPLVQTLVLPLMSYMQTNFIPLSSGKLSS